MRIFATEFTVINRSYADTFICGFSGGASGGIPGALSHYTPILIHFLVSNH